MRRIAVILNKGGVAKTTTAVNLAHGLSLENRRVLLVDTDDQGQCSKLLNIFPEKGLVDVLDEEHPIDPLEACVEARKNLYLLGGGEELALTKKMLSMKEMRTELTLLNALVNLEGEFDYVILDTSPSFDSLSLNVLFYCEEVLTPVSLESLSLDSLASFRKRLIKISKYNKDLKHRYLLPTFQDGRVKKSQEILSILEKHFSDILCHPIKYNAKLSESTAHGKTIFEFANDSIGAQGYKQLVKRIIKDERNNA